MTAKHSQSQSHITADTVSQPHLALSPYLGLVAIFLLYNRKFWVCMSRSALPDGWTDLSCEGSQSLSVSCVCILFISVLFFLIFIHSF
jgi:hypothetical protein